MADDIPTLIVPIDVAALCVAPADVVGAGDRPATSSFARLATNFSNLPYLDENQQPSQPAANLSEAVVPEPFLPAAAPLQAGVHLHWALPDAVAHGHSDGTNAITFPAAPNRWLIVRMTSTIGASTAPAAPKAWVVESDRLWDSQTAPDGLAQNANSRDVPIEPPSDGTSTKAFSRMGRVFAYEDWSEQPGSFVARHTALGYGVPTYAAAYDHCPNVFGFHDTLDDLDQAFDRVKHRISYLIAGWYSDSKDDPLTGINGKIPADAASHRSAVEAARGWTYLLANDGALPSRTMCAGLLLDVQWDAQQPCLQSRTVTPIDVAVGKTTAEALSALLASRPPLAGAGDSERLLNAFQAGLLARMCQPDFVAQLDELIHQKGFRSTAAGQIWTVKRVPAAKGATSPHAAGDALLRTAGMLHAPLPDPLARALNGLNVLQQQYDRAQDDIDALRGQIFADWYKYMILEYPEGPPPTDLITADKAFHYIKGEIDVLNGKISDQKTLGHSVKARSDALAAGLGNEYVLKPRASPRCWQPNDPVVLLSGDDVQPSRRYTDTAGRDKDGNLICRLANQIISSIDVRPDGPGLPAAALPQPPADRVAAYASEIQGLVAEAFFLDANQAWAVGTAMAKRGGNRNPAVDDLAGFVANLQSAQRALLSGAPAAGSIVFQGVPPTSAGLQSWSQPWMPLMLQWEIKYWPRLTAGGTSFVYDPACITSTYRLTDDAIDLTDPNYVPAHLADFNSYAGTVLLTHNTEVNLRGQIDTYVSQHADDPHVSELKALRDKLNLPMLAQSLDGLNAALLMRRATLQLPVFDPLASLNGFDHVQFSNVTVKTAVCDKNNTAPLPSNSYNPLQAGFFTIARLRIVDAFGQVRDLVNPPVIRAESLIPHGDPPGSTLINVAPRFTQAARLLFRWLSADDDQVETNSDPASSPICGWLLFNHLDVSLMIYDADGNPLGSLNARGALWRGAPGDAARFHEPIEDVFASANPHLRDFVLGIYQHPAATGFLGDLLAAIDSSLPSITPPGAQQDDALSVLIGRPLALVRASLKLELQGSPAIDQSWAAFSAAVDGKHFERRFDAGITRVRVPVRLGDLGKVSDGLIGYFIDDGTLAGYRTCYAAASARAGNGVVPPAFDQLTVVADSEALPVFVSMLVDPRAAVHATTGMLPVKQIVIPPIMYADALRRIAVTFLTAPVLSSVAQFALPVPDEHGYEWSWVALGPTSRHWTTSAIASVNPAGTFSYMPQQISEGWLKLSEVAPPPGDAQKK